jgi:hypothetical protein
MELLREGDASDPEPAVTSTGENLDPTLL